MRELEGRMSSVEDTRQLTRLPCLLSAGWAVGGKTAEASKDCWEVDGADLIFRRMIKRLRGGGGGGGRIGSILRRFAPTDGSSSVDLIFRRMIKGLRGGGGRSIGNILRRFAPTDGSSSLGATMLRVLLVPKDGLGRLEADGSNDCEDVS